MFIRQQAFFFLPQSEIKTNNMKNVIAVLLLTCFFLEAFAQKQERQLLVYNALLGGVTAGVGAAINKPKGAQLGRTMINAFWQGCLGGSINFSAKKTLYLITRDEQVAYALPARILHAAGNSIIENAAFNRPFLQSWNIDYGPVRFDFSLGKNRSFKARFLPATIFAVYLGWRDATIDVPYSLYSGTFCFRSKNELVTGLDGNLYSGYAFARSYTYAPLENQFKYRTIAHELVHIMQYRDYQVLNTWIAPLAGKMKNGKVKRLFDKYVYLDLPYFWLFNVLQGRHSLPDYFKNFYEFEAERFSTNTTVNR
jgi:hypothetical protein